jgi:hypothetical protein
MTVPSLINGEDEIKLMVYYGVGTYDEKGNELKYEEISGDGSWNEYDKNGKKIKNTYIIDNSNSVYYAEYDDRGNTIYWRYSNKKAGYGSETWNKYDNKNREIYYKKKYSNSETIDEHFIEYDKHGNQTKKYSDGSIIAEFNKFDRKGNNIYTKVESGEGKLLYEIFYKYDSAGRLIYKNDTASFHEECWYKYDRKGNKIYQKVLSVYNSETKIKEEFFEYDENNNMIYRKMPNEYEIRWKYDEKGNAIYFVNDSGVEEVYEYSYWKNGKLKEKRAYRNASSVDPKFLKSNNETSSSTD